MLYADCVKHENRLAIAELDQMFRVPRSSSVNSPSVQVNYPDGNECKRAHCYLLQSEDWLENLSNMALRDVAFSSNTCLASAD